MSELKSAYNFDTNHPYGRNPHHGMVLSEVVCTVVNGAVVEASVPLPFFPVMLRDVNAADAPAFAMGKVVFQPSPVPVQELHDHLDKHGYAEYIHTADRTAVNRAVFESRQLDAAYKKWNELSVEQRGSILSTATPANLTADEHKPYGLWLKVLHQRRKAAVDAGTLARFDANAQKPDPHDVPLWVRTLSEKFQFYDREYQQRRASAKKLAEFSSKALSSLMHKDNEARLRAIMGDKYSGNTHEELIRMVGTFGIDTRRFHSAMTKHEVSITSEDKPSIQHLYGGQHKPLAPEEEYPKFDRSDWDVKDKSGAWIPRSIMNRVFMLNHPMFDRQFTRAFQQAPVEIPEELIAALKSSAAVAAQKLNFTTTAPIHCAFFHIPRDRDFKTESEEAYRKRSRIPILAAPKKIKLHALVLTERAFEYFFRSMDSLHAVCHDPVALSDEVPSGDITVERLLAAQELRNRFFDIAECERAVIYRFFRELVVGRAIGDFLATTPIKSIKFCVGVTPDEISGGIVRINSDWAEVPFTPVALASAKRAEAPAAAAVAAAAPAAKPAASATAVDAPATAVAAAAQLKPPASAMASTPKSPVKSPMKPKQAPPVRAPAPAAVAPTTAVATVAASAPAPASAEANSAPDPHSTSNGTPAESKKRAGGEKAIGEQPPSKKTRTSIPIQFTAQIAPDSATAEINAKGAAVLAAKSAKQEIEASIKTATAQALKEFNDDISEIRRVRAETDKLSFEKQTESFQALLSEGSSLAMATYRKALDDMAKAMIANVSKALLTASTGSFVGLPPPAALPPAPSARSST